MGEQGQIGIVIVAHGGLAEEYKSTLEHVVGKRSGLEAVSIYNDDDRAKKRAEIAEAVKAADSGHGVVIVTDMFGGTPSNLALDCRIREDYEVLYGVNMPSLVTLARARDMSLQSALEKAVCAGHKYLNICGDRFRSR